MFWPQNLDSSDTQHIFVPDLLRSIPINYDDDVSFIYNDITLWRYKLNETPEKSIWSTQNPANAPYYMDQGDGMLNLASFHFGMPLYVSKPCFWGRADLLEPFKGKFNCNPYAVNGGVIEDDDDKKEVGNGYGVNGGVIEDDDDNKEVGNEYGVNGGVVEDEDDKKKNDAVEKNINDVVLDTNTDVVPSPSKAASSTNDDEEETTVISMRRVLVKKAGEMKDTVMGFLGGSNAVIGGSEDAGTGDNSGSSRVEISVASEEVSSPPNPKTANGVKESKTTSGKTISIPPSVELLRFTKNMANRFSEDLNVEVGGQGGPANTEDSSGAARKQEDKKNPKGKKPKKYNQEPAEYFYVDIEPNVGVAMNSRASMQISLRMKPLK